MGKRFTCYGQNVIAEPIDTKDDCIMSKVIETPFQQKCPIGSIIVYTERDYENLYIGNKLYHVLWEPRIRAILIDDDGEVVKHFPNIQKDVSN